MIQATIRIYGPQGQWKVHELAVSDGHGTRQHVYNDRDTYGAEEDAITIAKYQARLRVAKMWDSIAVDPIRWDIKTITHPLV
jgi:hypothetical protein